MEAALPFRMEAVRNAASAVLICLRLCHEPCVVFYVVSSHDALKFYFSMFVSFDVSRAVQLGGLQREVAEFIHTITLLVCEA